MSDLTVLLNRAQAGDADARSAATALIYDDLKRIAAAELRRHARHGTLNTTALVHEAWAKLSESHGAPLSDRKHYFRLAARAMRQVVVDHARAQLADKRGAGAVHVGLDEAANVAAGRARELLDLDESLGHLARTQPRAAQVVEWHVFGGMTFDEIAEALGVSERTARGDWAYARAVLAKTLAAP